MRRLYTKLDNFTVIAIHEDEKLKYFFVGDRNEEKISNKTFKRPIDAMKHGYELSNNKGY